MNIINKNNYELYNALSMLFPTLTLIYKSIDTNYNTFVVIQTIGFISLVPYSMLYHYSVYKGYDHKLVLFDLVSQHIGISIITYSLSNSFIYTMFCIICINSPISIYLILQNVDVEIKNNNYCAYHWKKISLCYLFAFLPMIYREDYYNFIMTILYCIISINFFKGYINKYITGLYGHSLMHVMLLFVCHHVSSSASKISY